MKVLASVSCMLCAAAFLLCPDMSGGSVFAQDNPNMDNMRGFQQPAETGPGNGQNNLEVITTADGFDNFDLGVASAECHISTNPLTPLWFLNAFNTNTTFRTTDGVTWAASSPNFGVSPNGDPVTAYDSLGHLYYETLFGGITGCKVIRSTDNGATWTASVTSVMGVDKNWIACDQTMGPNANNVYTCMTASTSGAFARSTDFGTTWTTTFSPTTQTLPGMMVAVGPNVLGGNNISGGCVYVITHSGTNGAGVYTMYLSTDGGLTFAQQSSNQFSNYIGTEINGRSTVQGMRCRPYPFIASDNSFGTYRGRLYLVYASNNPAGNGNKPDVFLRYSTDQGVTWSPAAAVNDDPASENNCQFHPAIWCDKETGRLYVQFYDTRRVPTSDSMDVYATYSDDGGVTFAPNQRLTNRTFRINFNGGTPPVYRGDYNSITSNRNTSVAVWTDFRNNNYLGMTSYFPDFAMLLSASNLYMRPTDSAVVRVKVPAVKLFTGTAWFSASVSPAAPFSFTFAGGKDSLTAYPDSLSLTILASGVTAGTYTITVTGSGVNGTPVHRRTMTVDVNTNASTVTVSAPNGGENWAAGSTHPITWTRAGLVDSVRIEYSTNNGSAWSTVTPGVAGVPGSYSWVVPNTPSTQALVRVAWTDSAGVNDVSNGTFILLPATFPVITTSPDSLTAALLGGGTTTIPLTVGNSGTAPLIWSLSESGPSTRPSAPQPQADQLYPGWRTGKGGQDRYHGPARAAADTSVGPDSAGYIATDSDTPGGPVFQWFDISTIGTLVTDWSRGGGTPDDGFLVVPLPWSFPFYGSTYDSLKIVTNGWLGFQTLSLNVDYGNSAIPSVSEPNLALYPFWDDMDLTSSGVVHYYNDSTNQRFVVQWTSVPHYSSGGPYTYQVQISRTGDILFQYLTMASVLNSATIGIENGSGTVAVQVIYNANYVHDSLAVRISRGLSWLSESPVGGTISAGGNQPVSVTFDATALVAGTYRGNLTILSNDPPRSPRRIPISLTVTTTGVTEGGSSPREFSLMQNYPNPFNPTTVISYAIPAPSVVRLRIFNLLGQEVATLVDGQQNAGAHNVTWNGNAGRGYPVSTGVYLYKLEARTGDGRSLSSIKKLVLMK